MRIEITKLFWTLKHVWNSIWEMWISQIKNWLLVFRTSLDSCFAGPVLFLLVLGTGPAGYFEDWHGPENGVWRWRQPNSNIYSQNFHFGIVYDVIYQFHRMEAKNYKFGMLCQQCYLSVAPGDADIQPRNASRIHTSHLFTF